MPELTVSMAAHNARQHIGAAIQSVLRQTGVDLELVVVDDGSSDDTAEVVGAGSDPRLRLIRTGCRRGDAQCHNLVAANSEAKFVVHLRPLDVVLPGALRVLCEAARRDSDTGLVHGYSFEIDEDGRITLEAFRGRRRLLREIRRPGTDARRELLRSAHAVDSFRLYRREAFLAVGGLDEGCGYDPEYDLALKIADRFTITLVPTFVCVRRQAPTVGWLRARRRGLARGVRWLLYCHRLRTTGRLRFVREARYNPYRLLVSGLEDPLGLRTVISAVRRAEARLRRRSGSALWQVGRRLGERLYTSLVARLTWWPLAAAGRQPGTVRRRIAYYTWRFPTLSETFIHRELAALKRAGLSVIVLAEGADQVEAVDHDGLSLLPETEYVGKADRRRVRRYHWRFLLTRPWRYASLLVYVVSRRYGPIKDVGEDLVVFSRCVHVAGLLEGRVDHLHSPWADRSAFIVSVASRLLGVTYSVHARAHDVHRTSYRAGLEDRFAHADFIVTNTRYNLEHLRPVVSPARRSRLFLIYNGLEPGRFILPPGAIRRAGPPRLLCVARLIEQKGLDHLLQACRVLEARGEEFECEVIGGVEAPLYTSYAVKLRQLHRRLGLERHVRFLGARPLAEVLEHYRQADVFVLPCVIAADGSRDITPNALIEAMAMKLPVVSTTVTGVPEIVETGVSGLLVPPADPEALADALGRLIRDAELRRCLGEQARRRVEERFDIDVNIARYVALFQGPAPGAEP